MRKWLILLSALSGTTASGAPAWTWVDANGTVHFSDRPEPGARQVELSGSPRVGSVTPAPIQTAARPPSPREQAGPVRYQADIVSPAEQETLWNTGGVVTVQTSVQPGLQPGHRVDLLLDGQRRDVGTASGSVTLPDVFRGAHTLQIVVVDARGTELTRSAPRTFFVQQTSVLNPNSANARPPAGAN
jgi:hypothetical protein